MEKLRFHLHALLNILCMASIFTSTTTLTSYGTMESYGTAPWLRYDKTTYPKYPPYPEKSPWYPVAGPYTYGPPAPGTSEHSSGFHQQQIVHIHEAGIPDISHGDNYHEGNDYSINNVISNVDALPYDLEHQASSNVETRKQKPKSKPKIMSVSNRRSGSMNSSRTKTNSQKRNDKIRRNQNNKVQNRKSGSKRQSMTRSKSSSRKTSGRQQTSRYSHDINRQIPRYSQQRRPQKRRARPTRRTHSKVSYYDYDDYNEYYDHPRRRYDNYRYEMGYNDYTSSEEDLTRQDDDDNQSEYEDSNEEDTTTAAESTTTETTEATTTVATTTTAASETTTPTEATTEAVSTSMGTTKNPGGNYFEGYGPSNGNENISITYAPSFEGRFEDDTPLTNFWYMHQNVPDTLRYQNYFTSNAMFN